MRVQIVSLTYDEIDKALTDACADRDAIAADRRAAQEEIERLRGELAEAQATIANERGEGEPPEVGWFRNDFDSGVISWTLYLDEAMDPVTVPDGETERWVLWAILTRATGKITWDVDECEEGGTVKTGSETSLRAAMRAAAKAVRGES